MKRVDSPFALPRGSGCAESGWGRGFPQGFRPRFRRDSGGFPQGFPRFCLRVWLAFLLPGGDVGTRVVAADGFFFVGREDDRGIWLEINTEERGAVDLFISPGSYSHSLQSVRIPNSPGF